MCLWDINPHMSTYRYRVLNIYMNEQIHAMHVTLGSMSLPCTLCYICREICADIDIDIDIDRSVYLSTWDIDTLDFVVNTCIE